MVSSVKKFHREFAAVTVTVTTALTNINDYVVADMDTVSFVVANSGSLTDQFEIQCQAISGGAFVTMHSAAGDYTTPTGLIVEASEDMTSLADAATAMVVVDTRGIYGIRLAAAVAATTSALTVTAGGS